jgi:hypothetical protein
MTWAKQPPTGATRRGQDRGGTGIHHLEKHISCQGYGSQRRDDPKGRSLGFMTHLPEGSHQRVAHF